MANQASQQDPNQIHTLMASSGTAGTAETRRLVVDDNNNLRVASFTSLIPKDYTNGSVSYTSTSDIYVFLSGTTPVGTITLTYTDSTKEFLQTFTRE